MLRWKISAHCLRTSTLTSTPPFLTLSDVSPQIFEVLWHTAKTTYFSPPFADRNRSPPVRTCPRVRKKLVYYEQFGYSSVIYVLAGRILSKIKSQVSILSPDIEYNRKQNSAPRYTQYTLTRENILRNQSMTWKLGMGFRPFISVRPLSPVFLFRLSDRPSVWVRFSPSFSRRSVTSIDKTFLQFPVLHQIRILFCTKIDHNLPSTVYSLKLICLFCVPHT